MSVVYEWDVEVVASVDNTKHFRYDIIEHLHKDSFEECLEELDLPVIEGYEKRVVLVRDDAKGRSWCYLDDGVLESHFHNAFLQVVCKVPERFRKEVSKHVCIKY